MEETIYDKIHDLIGEEIKKKNDNNEDISRGNSEILIAIVGNLAHYMRVLIRTFDMDEEQAEGFKKLVSGQLSEMIEELKQKDVNLN